MFDSVSDSDAVGLFFSREEAPIGAICCNPADMACNELSLAADETETELA